MKYAKTLLLLFFCGFLVAPAFSQPTKSQPAPTASTPSTQYPLNIRAVFVHGCISNDQSQPKPTEQRVRFCMCLLDRLQPKFTLSQFFELAPALQNDKRRENALEAFVEDQTPECI